MAYAPQKNAAAQSDEPMRENMLWAWGLYKPDEPERVESAVIECNYFTLKS